MLEKETLKIYSLLKEETVRPLVSQATQKLMLRIPKPEEILEPVQGAQPPDQQEVDGILREIT